MSQFFSFKINGLEIAPESGNFAGFFNLAVHKSPLLKRLTIWKKGTTSGKTGYFNKQALP